MDSWQTLVATALVGTGRQTPQPVGEGALKALLDQLDWSQPEGALLGAAGAISLHQRIGQHPPQKNWLTVEPCSLEDVPVVKPAIARHLDTAMNAHPHVLPELLSLIAQAGQRIPERQLPRLLQVGQQTASLRLHVAAVVGQRGQWLAAQQTDWSYARVGGAYECSLDSPQLQDIWANGRRSERILLLQRWRETDPKAASEALDAVWSTASAKDREAFIRLLEINLTMADEPFLEAALSDRAKSVRQAAINLSARLPQSHLCQRMAERIQSFIQLTDDGSGLQIDVMLPETYESEWERDGIRATAPADQSPRGWWLQEMLAATPLDIWGDPVAAVQAIGGHSWQEILMSGWGLAAHRQQRIDWVDALWDVLASQPCDDVLIEKLLTCLVPKQRALRLQEQLNRRLSKDDKIRWLRIVPRISQQWDLGFSQQLLVQLVMAIKKMDRNSYALAYTYATGRLQLTLHPDLAPDIASALEDISNAANSQRYWEDSLLQLLKTLNFRQEIHRVFPG